MTVARALYAFRGQEPGDLSFNEDEIIRILRQDESGWWEGQTDDGRRGDFPYNYVEVINQNEADGLREASRQVSNYNTRAGGGLQNDVVQGVRVTPVPNSAQFNIEASLGRKKVLAVKSMENFRDLDMNLRYLYPNFDRPLPPYWADKVYESEQASRRRAKVLQIYLDRLVGNNNDVTEWAVISWMNPRESFAASPAAKGSVKEAQQDAAKRGGGRNSYGAAMSNAYPLARAEYDWNATDAVELPLQRGTIIAVRNQQTPSAGWWEGETSDGQRGLFPSNYVKMLSQTEAKQVVLGQGGAPSPSPRMQAFNPNSMFSSPGPANLGMPIGMSSSKGPSSKGGKSSSRQRKTENNFAMPSLDAFDELLLEGFTMLQNNKVLIPKNDAQSPREGDTVALSYTAYVWDCQKQRIIEFAASDLPDSSNYTGPLRFCIGKGDTIKALERAVQNLEVGQESRIVVRPDMGYGEVGNPPSVPPNCHLVYDVKLDQVEGMGLPPPPSMNPPQQYSNPTPMMDMYSPPPQQQQQSRPSPYATITSPSIKSPPPGMGGMNTGGGYVPKGAVPTFGPGGGVNSLADAVASRAGAFGGGHRSNAPIQARPKRTHNYQQQQYVAPQQNYNNGGGAPRQQQQRQPVQKYGLDQMRTIVLNKKYEEFNVDPAFLEDCLTDDGFQEAFSCTRAQFLLMPKWKQNKLKQDAGLY